MLDKLWSSFEKEFIGQSRVFEPVSSSIYHGRMSDTEIEQMRKRNEMAIKQCIQKMDYKWVLHPSHSVKRLDK